ncbi:MAG: cadmium-translocating P-type ATPase [Clostridiales bacterium]|nr:cadmium-translocating P-type ATPase [Clostridiales bacterium]
MNLNRMLTPLIISTALFITALIANISNEYVLIALFLTAGLIAGHRVIFKALLSIKNGQIFNENFLMSIAAIGAFLIGEYAEGVAVMLFYRIGEVFETYAVNKSRRSISSLMELRPDHANVMFDGEMRTTDPEDVEVGQLIAVKPGERVPLDARVVEGNSMIDTSALTGESIPKEIEPGDTLLSGSINLNGILIAEVTSRFEESTVSKILEMVENSLSRKAQSERFITRFARFYTPVVVALAALISVVPPLLVSGQEFSDWIYRALVFLVISCPCALVISVPLGFFGGIGGASRQGILVKGGNSLEDLALTEIVVFDKTGTLTKGVFSVSDIKTVEMSRETLLEIAAHAESFSDHPVSQSLLTAYGEETDKERISEAEELPGHGVRSVVDGKTVLVGNAKLMDRFGITRQDMYPVNVARTGVVIHVAIDGNYSGAVLIADSLKEDAAETIRTLKKSGVKRTVMLTGDVHEAGTAVAEKLGLDEVYSDLLPVDKVEIFESLLSMASKSGKVAFVGDGINDAPVLARADIGIAMGGLGSDAAIEASDIVIMTDEPKKVVDAIRISKRTNRIVRQNIVFSIGIKGLILILAAAGVASMWVGVFADVGVTILAIFNSMRALKLLGNR